MENILDSFDDYKQQELRKAKKETRFLHAILDTIAFYFIFFLLAILMGSTGIDLEESDSFGFIAILSYPLYYILFEHLFGKTPAKFLTKTHVVTLNGEKPSLLNIIGRNVARFIPLDNFSFLFSDGFHDMLSRTTVVYDDGKF